MNNFTAALLLCVLIAAFTPGAPIADSPFIASKPLTHEETVETGTHDYSIRLGGTADMDNTTTNGYGRYDVAFQPNISLEIENIGPEPVVDPWIVVNSLNDFRTIDSIVEEATRGARSEQERLLMLYEFARSRRYHDYPQFQGDELHDPVRHFNCYAAGFCDDIGRVTCALAYRAGFTKERHGGDPILRSMHGHVMSEISVDGRYQFIDTDENAFYLDVNNERPVGGDEIVRDSDLCARDYTYGPLFRSWGTGEKAAALLGRDDTKGRSITIGHEMRLTLRPGEKLTLRWDNIGATPGERTLKYFGNSFLDYEPALDGTFLRLAGEAANARAVDGEIHRGNGGEARIEIPVESPWVICGGTVAGAFAGSGAGDTADVSVSTGDGWTTVWDASGAGPHSCDASLGDALGVGGETARYRYDVRVKITGDMRLTSLSLHSVLLASPIALPRLSLGKNSVRYTDASSGKRRVLIRHTWRESGNVAPPAAPGLLTPAARRVCRDEAVAFAWNPVPGADRYRLRVSTRPDLATSYRPCYDVVIDETTFANGRAGLFADGRTYYWSVKARDASGLWGDWAPVREFSWKGPMPPVDLRIVSRGGKIYLSWKPNPRGVRPVSYEVYASDIRGFTPSMKEHELVSLGTAPPNFAGSTDLAEFPVVSPDPADGAPNKSSYKVVAVDEKGTRSGPSEPLELEHPHIFSRPVTEARTGEPYEYRVMTIRSMGDLQYRYQEPSYAFWEREGYEFRLADAPGWLRIDPVGGILSGTPGERDTGDHRVTVVVDRTWPHEVKANQKRPENFTKDGPEYRASDEQTFVLRVRR